MDATRRFLEIGGWLAGTDIDLLELRTPAFAIRLERSAPGAAPGPHAPGTIDAPLATATAKTATPAPETAAIVRATSVGVFLDTHPLAAAPLAPPGARVVAGEVIALLRIGALLLPVTAPTAGIVGERLAPTGRAVGHGTALLAFQPL